MRAVQLNAYGSVSNFENVEVPMPEAGPGQLRVKVAYGGLRWSDIMGRNGWPTRRHETPFISGRELGGYVDQIGEGVTGFALGQPLVAQTFKGAWAEYALVEPGGVWQVWTVPENIPLDRAVGYPANMVTAHLLVYTWGKVVEGQTVLLHSAAGGVGLCVLQILKRRFRNVTVIGICGSEAKAKLLEKSGCDHVINRRTHDYVQEVNRIRGPKATGRVAAGEQGGGVDVVLNGVCTDETFTKDAQVVRKRGRWILFGYPHSETPHMPTLDVESILYDGITIIPASQYAWWGTPDFEAAEKFTREWLASEPLVPTEVWPLSKVGEAQTALEEGRTTGKVVFKVAEND